MTGGLLCGSGGICSATLNFVESCLLTVAQSDKNCWPLTNLAACCGKA